MASRWLLQLQVLGTLDPRLKKSNGKFNHPDQGGKMLTTRFACSAAAALAVTLTACGSTGVVPMGEGRYIVTKKSAGCGFSSGEGTKVDLYREAGEFCATLRKEPKTIEAVARDGVPFVRCASAELQFQCVDPAK